MTRIEHHLGAAVELRHRLHRIPELMFEEHQTAAMIRLALDELRIDYVAGVENAPTATIAMLGDVGKPCIALRADIDALPIQEQTGLPYTSTHPGRMHACGHDGHSATLVGTAAELKRIVAELPVCVKLIWQPAEEGGAGGERLVKAGVLDGRVGPKVSAIFGLHGWPGLPVGTVATKAGALLANTDNFAITFTGRGCHGAYPQLGRDPIVTAAEAILNLQQMVSREVDPTDSAVVTIGVVRAGTATNVIPDTAVIEGTARTVTPQVRQQLQAAIRRRVAGIAAANDCEAKVDWMDGYPATVNDPAMADFVAATVKRVFGAERYFPILKPSMGGEDFAYYLEKVPGCFFLVGVDPVGGPPKPPLHNDRYDFGDEALGVGMRMFVELVRGFCEPIR